MLLVNLTARRVVLTTSPSCQPLNPTSTRTMATLKAISLRLKSVKNIQKITQSMKMVSAAKYARAERELRLARPFGIGAQAFYEKAEVAAPDDPNINRVLVAMTSDRGLCGAVHSSVAKQIRSELQNSPNPGATKVICIGDKSRSLLQRLFAQNIILAGKEIGRKVPVFQDAGRIAEEILNCGFEYEHGTLYYNRFKSVVSYQTSKLPIYSLKAVNAAPKLTLYDSIDSDVMQSYIEYSLASKIYYTMKENACSEQSSRMTAMDNASKNAGEMIAKLSLTFNRTRQAVITRELIEIISGASAL